MIKGKTPEEIRKVREKEGKIVFFFCCEVSGKKKKKKLTTFFFHLLSKPNRHQTFNIPNDFTPEEEEEVRRENQWAFE